MAQVILKLEIPRWRIAVAQAVIMVVAVVTLGRADVSGALAAWIARGVGVLQRGGWLVKHYTIENTVKLGKNVHAFINGSERKWLTEIWQLGPIILARGHLHDTNGKVVFDRNRDSFVDLWHFGVGRVTLTSGV